MPDMWPSTLNSLDSNTVDCAMWGALQKQVCHGRKFDTVDHLKQAIVLESCELVQRFIGHIFGEWRSHLLQYMIA